MSELNAKVDEGNRAVNDLQSQKNRLQQEAAELTRQLEDAEHQVGSLQKEKTNLASQLDEAKRSLEDETRVCFTSLFIGYIRSDYWLQFGALNFFRNFVIVCKIKYGNCSLLCFIICL